jgi:hypothetical protein
VGATGATLAAGSTGNDVEDEMCVALGGVEVIGCPATELPCPPASHCGAFVVASDVVWIMRGTCPPCPSTFICNNGSVDGDDGDNDNGDCSTKCMSGSDGRAVMAGHARDALGNQSACQRSSGSSIFDGLTGTFSLVTAGADGDMN